MNAALQASASRFCAKAGEGPMAAGLASSAKAIIFEIRDLKITRLIPHSSIANSVPSEG
jgi:hypothetical protein